MSFALILSATAASVEALHAYMALISATLLCAGRSCSNFNFTSTPVVAVHSSSWPLFVMCLSFVDRASTKAAQHILGSDGGNHV